MSFISKIAAAPQLVHWTGYKPEEMNTKKYAKLTADRRKRLVETLADGVFLYALPDKFFVADERQHRLLYVVQYVRKTIFGAPAITQTQVWRDKSSPLTKGLAERLFFDHLFPQAACIVTDRQQTSYGKAFWELRIYEAFQKNLPVYLLEQNTHSKTRLSSARDFDALADSWWGEEHKFQARKIAICHQPLW